MSQEYLSIIKDIKNRKFVSVYFLAGDEPFFIDKITDELEKVLPEEEQAFNQTIVYGKEVSMADVLSYAKQYPMGGEQTLVLVKEAQNIPKNQWDELVSYVENPQPTTLLAFAYKDKKLDKRSKLYKVLTKNQTYFEGKKLYDNQVPEFIESAFLEQGIPLSQKVKFLLAESLGGDLSRITNEAKRLSLVVEKGEALTEEMVEYHVGISKSFNNFELIKAFGRKDIAKIYQILEYFEKDPTSHPVVLTVSLLFNFFSNLMVYSVLEDKSKPSVAQALKINPYFVGDYVSASSFYPLKKITAVISLLRELDIKTKGIGSESTSPYNLTKEFAQKVMYL